MKYPPEMVRKAREHYGFDEETAGKIPIHLLKSLAFNSHFVTRDTGKRKPVGMEIYSSLEIAEIIKDIDRHV